VEDQGTLELDLPAYRGSLRGLVEAAERGEVDLSQVSLEQVARQVWARAEGDGHLDPEDLVEFIAALARLLELKAAALLPRPQSSASAATEREAHPGQEEDLATALERLEPFREAAQLLRAWEEARRRAYTRQAPPRGVPMPSGLRGVTLDDLVRLVQEVLAQRPPEPVPLRFEEDIPRIEAKMDELLWAVRATGGPLPFRRVLEDCRTRREVVAVFLAVLELIKQGKLWAQQEQPFGEILLVEAEPPPP
jgi:segregation and condensation protein A